MRGHADRGGGSGRGREGREGDGRRDRQGRGRRFGFVRVGRGRGGRRRGKVSCCASRIMDHFRAAPGDDTKAEAEAQRSRERPSVADASLLAFAGPPRATATTRGRSPKRKGTGRRGPKVTRGSLRRRKKSPGSREVRLSWPRSGRRAGRGAPSHSPATDSKTKKKRESDGADR